MLIYTYLFWLSQISDGLIFYPQLKIYKNEKLYHVTNTQDLSYTISYTIFDDEHRIRSKLYDKGVDFNFQIVNFPFICSNIPSYRVDLFNPSGFIGQMIAADEQTAYESFHDGQFEIFTSNVFWSAS